MKFGGQKGAIGRKEIWVQTLNTNLPWDSMKRPQKPEFSHLRKGEIESEQGGLTDHNSFSCAGDRPY